MLLVFLILFTGFGCAASIRCLECRDMPNPQECLTTTTCSANQECYVEQFVSSGGLILFNSGCKSTDRCAAARQQAIIGRRSGSDINVCVQCCTNEFCNNQGCGTTALTQPHRGPVCFNCPVEEDPENCRDLIECDPGQQCALTVNRDFHSPTTLYKSGCSSAIQCRVLTLLAAGMVGKRSTTSVNHCPRCCQGDFCNDSCRQNITTHVAQTSTGVPLTTNKPTTKPTTKFTTQAPTRSTTKSTMKLTTKPTTKPTTTPTTKRTTKYLTIPTIKTSTTLSTKATRRPTTKPTTRPTTRHKTKSTTKPTTKPTIKSTTTFTTKPTTKPTTKSTTKHTIKPTTKPTTKATTKPTTKLTTKSTTKRTTRPTTKITTTSTTTLPSTTSSTTLMTTSDPAAACKADHYLYNAGTNLCLKFHVTPLLNWTDAQTVCQSEGGILAVITTSQKLNDIKHFLSTIRRYHGISFWIGANNKNAFMWTDGKPLILSAQNIDLSDAKCVFTRSDKTYDTDKCSEKHAFICERSKSVRP